MTPFTTYLNELRATRASGAGTAETSFYPAIKALLDGVGDTLRPKVRCIMNLRNQGAGLPDGGLFTADQLGRGGRDPGEESTLLAGAAPARGAIEVKPPSWHMRTLASSSQASRYGTRYRHVLLTNLREFWLLEQDPNARPRILERFAIASSEQELWHLASHPNEEAANALEGRLMLFLERALRLPAPLEAPEDLAWFLASYARDALYSIEHGNSAGLDDVAEALGRALGVGFRGDKGKHFFHSTLVQTLFYGVFSAWVLWSRKPRRKEDRFSWKDTSELLHLTMLRVLFHEMTRPTTLFTNFLREGLDLAEATLNRVDRGAFFSRFEQHEAVQYFYEPFLEAFDPALRRELGVWYTPREVVSYMVERIDRALRDQLGVANGLADPTVQVLDPCCGTGTYLIAVLERIAHTLRDQGEDATVAAQVAQAAAERVFGFEILPAPYVIAHLQIALHLQELGAPLAPDARALVYLTNALTGWAPVLTRGRQERLLPELAAERDAADKVKQKTKILVVLGNPPYNAFAGVQPAEELESVDVYKEGLWKRWGVRKYNLDDLFIRFFRLAEKKIAEQMKRGIVCFISNAAYTSDSSFVVFRERFLQQFDTITIDNLNGDSRETGKITPEGKPDPSVFSTERNREGIRVGTAVGLFVRTGEKHLKPTRVRWREFWGAAKRSELLESLRKPEKYETVVPKEPTRWSFKPQAGSAAYHSWPHITDLCQYDPISGLAEKRKGGLFAIVRQALADRMETYFDARTEWSEAKELIGELANDAADYKARATRERFLKRGETFQADQIRRYALLPFDNRWCYWSDAPPLWNRSRPILSEQAWPGNAFLIVRPVARQPHEGCPSYVTSALPDHHMLDPNVVAIPLRWRASVLGAARTAANLSASARAYLSALGVGDPDEDESMGCAIWYHCLAITYSPAYLAENGDAVRAAYPRVPLPANRDLLRRSGALGRRLADLLDPEAAVVGVTAGNIRTELRALGALARDDRKQIDPSGGDLALEARWGTLQRGTIVMPGPGKTTAAMDPVLKHHPLRAGAIDVSLNGRVAWRNVPGGVWEFSIGGYQVIKKWLSYREKSVLGRDLTLDEAKHVTSMVRRIAAILLLHKDLDDAYRESRDAAYEQTERNDAASARPVTRKKRRA